MEAFGVDIYAKRRALLVLEKAGLIRVDRKPGHSPVVTILEVGDGDARSDFPNVSLSGRAS
jgi:ABC-type metal ion transport system substrate-binding protein